MVFLQIPFSNFCTPSIYFRNILAQSQLPNSVLAEIWNLSDYNKDGRLSVEEFCVAMHLIDSVKVLICLFSSIL